MGLSSVAATLRTLVQILKKQHGSDEWLTQLRNKIVQGEPEGWVKILTTKTASLREWGRACGGPATRCQLLQRWHGLEELRSLTPQRGGSQDVSFQVFPTPAPGHVQQLSVLPDRCLRWRALPGTKACAAQPEGLKPCLATWVSRRHALKLHTFISGWDDATWAIHIVPCKAHSATTTNYVVLSVIHLQLELLN